MWNKNELGYRWKKLYTFIYIFMKFQYELFELIYRMPIYCI